MVLGVNDVVKVLDELYDIRAKWYDIGLRLNVPAETLEKIRAPDDNSCLRQVLIIWLRSGKATWTNLCQVLRHRTIDQGKLADSLLAKYHTARGTVQSTESQSARSNASGGTSGAVCPSTSGKSNTSPNPTQDRHGTEGTPKSKEKPSASAAKSGEAGPSKAKKRPSTSDTPGPSAAKKPKQATSKLPDSFAKDDFIRTPPPDRLCVKCDRVPFNPQRSICCKRLYCEPCSKKNKRCRTHKADLEYTFDKELYGKIQKLKIKCPNRGDGCDWSDLVLNLKNHLPACGGQAQGKGAGTQKSQQSEKASKTYSKRTESGPNVAMANQIHVTVTVGDKDKQKQEAGEGGSSSTSLNGTSTGEGHHRQDETLSTEAAVAKPTDGEANGSSATMEDAQGTSTASCLPLNVVMKPVCDYQASTGKTWFSPVFLSHQLGYKLRLAVKIQPQASLPLNENLQLNVGIVSAPEDQEDFLKFPCIGDATVQILNPEKNKRRIDIPVGFMIGDESERFTYASVLKTYIHRNCLFFRVVKIDLDDEYKPWLLDPHMEVDDSMSVDSE